MRINKPVVGFLLGLVLPVVGFFIVFLCLRNTQSLSQFVGNMKLPRIAAFYISLSLLANAIPFAIFNTRRLDYAARGVFIATMLYALVIIFFRFVW